MGSVTRFIAERGMMLTLCGFGTAILGSGAYIYFGNSIGRVRYMSMYLDKIALAVAFLGIAVYFIGRISTIMQRRTDRYRRFASDDDTYEDDGGGKEYAKARTVGGVKAEGVSDEEAFVLPTAAGAETINGDSK